MMGRNISLSANIVNRPISKESFDCGNSSINDLVYASPFLTLLNFAISYELINEKRIVGYYMIDFKELRIDDCPESVRECTDSHAETCMAARIRYIAIKKENQGVGFGTNALAEIVTTLLQASQDTPIRLIILDALKELCKWYEKRGFFYYNNEEKETSTGSTVRMYMDCISDVDALIEAHEMFV